MGLGPHTGSLDPLKNTKYMWLCPFFSDFSPQLTCVWRVRQTGSTGSCICPPCWTWPWLSGSSRGTSVPAWTWRHGRTGRTGDPLPLISASAAPGTRPPAPRPRGPQPSLPPHLFPVPASPRQRRQRLWKPRVDPSWRPHPCRGRLVQPPPGRR